MTRRVQSVLCIACPTGCDGEVVIDNGAVVKMRGYTCKIGRDYIREEVIAPKRIVTTTVRVNGGALALLPVVSDRPVPKESIFASLALLRKVAVTAPVEAGSVVLANALGLGINFVATRDCQTFGSPAWTEARKDVATAPQGELEALEPSEGPQFFDKQFALLRKRLLNDPKSLRRVFIDDGIHAVAWEFRQDQLGARFTETLWNLLLRNDAVSAILQRFISDAPLDQKRKFIAAIDAHLSDRYPMFEGLSEGWPAEDSIKPAGEHRQDFDRVTTGRPGTRARGYSMREIDLFAWLEALRDQQCEDRPYEQGSIINGHEAGGGDPHPGHAEPAGAGQAAGSPQADTGVQSAA